MKCKTQMKDRTEELPAGIPKAVLELLRVRWQSDTRSQELFDWVLGLRMNCADSTTCASVYVVEKVGRFSDHDIFSFDELRKLIADGVLPGWGFKQKTDIIYLNEHVAHSLVQLFARVMSEWDAHEHRLKQIQFTPHGRIQSS